jgi:hypothetical protein
MGPLIVMQNLFGRNSLIYFHVRPIAFGVRSDSYSSIFLTMV